MKLNSTKKVTNQIPFQFPPLIGSSIPDKISPIVSFTSYCYIVSINQTYAQRIHESIQQFFKTKLSHKEANYSQFIKFEKSSNVHPIMSDISISGEELFALVNHIKEFLQQQESNNHYIFVCLDTGQKAIYSKVIGNDFIMNKIKSNPLNHISQFSGSFFNDKKMKSGQINYTVTVTIDGKNERDEQLIFLNKFSEYSSQTNKKIHCYPCLGCSSYGNIVDKTQESINLHSGSITLQRKTIYNANSNHLTRSVPKLGYYAQKQLTTSQILLSIHQQNEFLHLLNQDNCQFLRFEYLITLDMKLLQENDDILQEITNYFIQKTYSSIKQKKITAFKKIEMVPIIKQSMGFITSSIHYLLKRYSISGKNNIIQNIPKFNSEALQFEISLRYIYYKYIILIFFLL